MSFPVTIEGTMWDALYLNQLKYSDGFRVYASIGVTISWLSDTRFRAVLPSNENIGTQILCTYPNYYGRLLTQTAIFSQAYYTWERQLINLGTLIFGITQETISHEEILVDSIAISPGSFTAILPNSILNFTKPYTAIITTPGEYTLTYSKSGYSTATKNVIVKEWKDGDDVRPIMVDAELTLLSGQYYGDLKGDVKIDINTPNPNVDVKATISGGSFIAKTKTDDKGNYSFHLPVGTYTVKFSKQGYENASISITITAGNTMNYGMWLPETKAVITGKIYYKSQYDVNGIVRLDLLHPRWSRSETIYVPVSESLFRFASLLKGNYKIVASLEGQPQLYGNTHWMSLENNERKRTFIDMASHVANSLTSEELTLLSIPPPRKDIVYPFPGAQTILTRMTSL